MMTEKKVIVTGPGGGRVSVECRHGLSFCRPVPMLLPCFKNSGLLSDHKAISRWCNHRMGCSDKDVLLFPRLVTLFLQTGERKNNEMIN